MASRPGSRTTTVAPLPWRKGDPHSATAQFFINHGNNDMLNFPSRDGWGYVAFGRVVSGTDVLDKIAELPTSPKGMHQTCRKPRSLSKSYAARKEIGTWHVKFTTNHGEFTPTSTRRTPPTQQ